MRSVFVDFRKAKEGSVPVWAVDTIKHIFLGYHVCLVHLFDDEIGLVPYLKIGDHRVSVVFVV
jgi:hypothetical protein